MNIRIEGKTIVVCPFIVFVSITSFIGTAVILRTIFRGE